MLVRSGDVTVRQLLCPNSSDTPDQTDDVMAVWDFASPSNVSYGFPVPYGPPKTRAGEWMDSRVAVAADKGPYTSAGAPVPAASLEVYDALRSRSTRDARSEWRSFNSRNHGGEGQNVLFADSHVEFVSTPTVGVDLDNIYTAAGDNAAPASYRYGVSPWNGSPHPFAPRGADDQPIASTDSLIYP